MRTARIERIDPGVADRGDPQIPVSGVAPTPVEPHVRSQAVYFGPSDRPLFGAVHRPRSTWTGTRILLCGPLGYEGLFSYLTLNDLGMKLAESAAAVVMRFDYDGCGDSAGGDEDQGRVARMLAGIHHAIDYLKGLSDTPGPLVVIGLRAGALLAACAAAQRDDVTAIALWAPCASGKAFLREQRVFSQLTASNPDAPPGLERSWGPQGFEANGYVFTDETVTALEQLNLKTLATPPAPRILLLQRAELGSGLRAPPAWSRAEIEEQHAPGYAEMMEPPWLWSLPAEAFQRLSEWVGRVTASHTGPPATYLSPGGDSALTAPGIQERAVRFGPGDNLFGILTRPVQGGGSQAVVLVTSTYGYRIGPNRLNVVLARRLAAMGIASIRLDVRGVGDSRGEYGATPGGPYDDGPIEDVLHAVRHLKDEGYTRIALQGVCAGAYYAWQAALETKEQVTLFLANLETFVPIHYTRDEHMAFMAKGPESAEPQPATGIALKLQTAQKTARRYLGYGRRALVASVPSRLRPTELPAHLVALGRRASRVVLIFSKSDLGMGRYLLGTGLHHLRLTLQGVVSLRVIDAADHSFTPRWAAERLLEVVTGEIDAWAHPQRR